MPKDLVVQPTNVWSMAVWASAAWTWGRWAVAGGLAMARWCVERRQARLYGPGKLTFGPRPLRRRRPF